MKTVIETNDIKLAHEIDALATALLNQADDAFSRTQAAAIVSEFSFTPYIGGHHVAVHLTPLSSHLENARLAIITHDAPDWL